MACDAGICNGMEASLVLGLLDASLEMQWGAGISRDAQKRNLLTHVNDLRHTKKLRLQI